MPPPALQLDELVEEILLRIPPGEPERLARAALACKRWRRLASSPGFRRRFCARHGAPPLLGVLRNIVGWDWEYTDLDIVDREYPEIDVTGFAVDSLHGRVLLHSTPPMFQTVGSFAVWDPVTDGHWELPALPRLPQQYGWKAAVLCNVTNGACDHLDCSQGPFLVAFVGAENSRVFSSIYSSEAGVWSEPKYTPWYGYLAGGVRAALVGNTLYFVLAEPTGILECDLSTGEMTVAYLPPPPNGRFVLTTAEDGGLGTLTLEGSRLYLWSREAGPDGEMRWAKGKLIELETFLSVGAKLISFDMVGFEAGVGVVYVGTKDASFIIHLKSGQVCTIGGFNSSGDIVPYMGFYTPASEPKGLAAPDAVYEQEHKVVPEELGVGVQEEPVPEADPNFSSTSLADQGRGNDLYR
ncbi:hypothetical protein ACP4OV_012270 [Aristida adscensionis]